MSKLQQPQMTVSNSKQLSIDYDEFFEYLIDELDSASSDFIRTYLHEYTDLEGEEFTRVTNEISEVIAHRLKISVVS